MVQGFKIGVAVGSGVVARAAEEGGADFLLALSAGRLRNMGTSSIACMLPLARADETTLSFATEEVLPQSKIPVYLGVTAWPGSIRHAAIAQTVALNGFAGASNFPSAIHFPPGMQRVLDAAGQGVEAEIALLSAVRAAGKRALFYCHTRRQAQRAAEAGLDGIVFNYGWNVGGVVGHISELSLEEAALIARDVVKLTRSIKPDIEIYLEGGPILTAQDLQSVARTAAISGYVGGSTIDRFPVQHSVVNRIAEYKSAAIVVPEHPKEAVAALSRLADAGLAGQSDALAQCAVETVRMSQSDRHVVLTAEEGCNPHPIIELLTTRQAHDRQSRIEVFDFDTALSVHQINVMLFGRQGGERSVRGILAQDDVSAVVFRNAGQIPRLIARKLTTTLRDDQVTSVGQHRRSRLLARVILCYEDGAPPDPDISGLTGKVQQLVFPPLRKRYEDIPMQIDAIFNALGLGIRRPVIQPAAFRVLSAHNWPRNDLELSELALRLSNMPTDKLIEAHEIRPLLAPPQIELRAKSEQATMRQRVIEALVQNGFRKGETAKSLHISRKTLYNWMKRLDLR